jgi:hypothetical protein
MDSIRRKGAADTEITEDGGELQRSAHSPYGFLVRRRPPAEVDWPDGFG